MPDDGAMDDIMDYVRKNEIQNKQKSKGEEMRIYFTLKNGEMVFGALMVDIVSYWGKATHQQTREERFYFATKAHGIVWVNKEMLDRVIERFRVNLIDSSILKLALK